MILILWK